MNNKKKILILSIVLLLVVLLVAGGTYAYWSWNSSVNKDVVFNTSKSIAEYVIYDEGDSLFVGDFQPKESFCQSTSTTLSFYKTSEANNVNLGTTINMSVNFIGSNISQSDSVYWVLTKGDASISCSSNLNSMQVINYGTFNGVTNGQIITLKSNIDITTTEQKFTVWIWINSSGSNLSLLSGETVDANVWSQIDLLDNSPKPAPEAPALDAGMIPVKIANDGTVTTVDETDPTWYSYDNKEWANAVLVKNSGTQLRSYYKNNSNITIPEEDILAYYVWIPRYKYQIWTVDATTTTSPQTIGIEFESKMASVENGTTVGSWKTHPAFIWDGETVAGLWVGKFETGHSTLSSSTTNNNLSCTDENCVNADGIIIKPNVVSLRYNSVSNQFYASRSMSRSSNPFGLSSSITNTHMMKNSEWGAVAYLSHSEYGVNTQIRINNNSSYTTGCGASEENGSYNSSCQIAYGGATRYPQSTTGNITGVFDISGGAYEYVMGNYADTISYAGFSAMPSSKYYDLYSITSMSSCTIETCGGHALFETAGWYSDYGELVGSDYPWFLRGDYHDNGSDAGAFNACGYFGDADVYFSWRSVLVVR